MCPEAVLRVPNRARLRFPSPGFCVQSLPSATQDANANACLGWHADDTTLLFVAVTALVVDVARAQPRVCNCRACDSNRNDPALPPRRSPAFPSNMTVWLCDGGCGALLTYHVCFCNASARSRGLEVAGRRAGAPRLGIYGPLRVWASRGSIRGPTNQQLKGVLPPSPATDI